MSRAISSSIGPLDDARALMLRQILFDGLEFEGRSMIPVLRTGDRIRITAANAPPRVGDLVVLRSKRELLLHRVVHVDVRHRRLVTRGDTNVSEDQAISYEQVLGTFALVLDPRCQRYRPLYGYRRLWNRLMCRLTRARVAGISPSDGIAILWHWVRLAYGVWRRHGRISFRWSRL